MNSEIEAFNSAFTALKQAESALDRKVEIEIANRFNDFNLLMDLVDMLPTQYNGVRRIWERIYRLDSGN